MQDSYEYIEDADDSSDDEEVGAFYSPQPKLLKKKGSQTYRVDIFSNFKKPLPLTYQEITSNAFDFQQDTKKYYGYIQSNEWTWYLIIQQLGIDLLYQPTVERIYREKKRTYMGKSILSSPTKSPSEIDAIIQAVAKENNQPLSKRTVALMLIERENWLSRTYDFTLSESVRRACSANNISLIRDNLMNATVTFVSQNIYEYLANLRQSNRSIKRYIQAKRQSNDRELCKVNRKWQLLPNQEESSELQKISYSQLTQSYSRSDKEVHLGKYVAEVGKSTKQHSIQTRIAILQQQLQMRFPFSDADIARYLRLTLLHKPITYPQNLSVEERSTIEQFLVSFTHLLFGIEVVRSPEVILIHQMLLDLIIANQTVWSWNSVLANHISASFNKGIVKDMRKANNDLHPYLSYPYYYPASMEDKVRKKQLNELYDKTLANYVKQQTNVVVAWKTLKCPNVDADTLVNVIQAAYKDWFEMDIVPRQSIQQITENKHNLNI